MATDKHVKLTLEDLIAKKAQREQDKFKMKECYIESLDGYITIQKCDLKLVLDSIDSINADDSMTNVVQVDKNLIYNSVPLFKSKELLAQYDLVEPYDIVSELLELGEILKLGDEILSLHGLDKIGESVKK